MTSSGRYEPGRAGGRPRDGVEAPVRPVLSGRRGFRQRFGMVGVGAIAVTVLAAGIGLGGRGLVPDPSASTKPVPTGTPAPSGPRSSVPSLPPPTPLPGAACVPADPTNPPDIHLQSTADGAPNVFGIKGQPDWELSTPQTLGWPTPRRTTALILDSSSDIMLWSAQGECIRYAVAEYLAVDDLGEVPTPIGLGEINVTPPSRAVVLGSPPAGDWIVRVVAYFSTGVAGNEDKALTERFFRVTSAEDPTVSPDVTPSIACGTLPVDGPIGLSMQAGDGAPAPGVNLETFQGDLAHNGALVTGAYLDALVIRPEADACATSWFIEWLDSYNNVMNELRQDNPNENPFLVSQNRIPLTGTSYVGHVVIRATVNFGGGRTASAAWEVVTGSPPTPQVFIAGPDGNAVVGAPTCGSSWTFEDGTSAYEMCDAYPIPDTIRLLTLHDGDIVDVDSLGWEVTSWNVICGSRGGGDGSEFQYDGSCDLGSGPDAPVRFLPNLGRSIVQVYVNVVKNGVSIYVGEFVEILVEP